MKQPGLIRVSALAALIFFSPPSARASVTASGEAEVMLTMASLAYQAKDYPRSREILNKMLKLDMKNDDARELLALTQKAMKDDAAAAKTYERLLADGKPEKAPAYHFELAMLRYKQKNLKEARRHFSLSALGNFNAGTSNFFLGVMDFNAKEWRAARIHLASALTYSDAEAVLPVTRFYLANTYAQLGKTDAAIHNYYVVDQLAEESAVSSSGIDDMTAGIRTSALKELKALDKNQRFASISFMQQFDSNVQTNPTEVDNPVAASSQRSGKSVLSISTGYSTSPTKVIQITPTFNYYTNYNYNYLARNFNFMTFTPAVFAVYKPYARLTVGLKADGIFSEQNMLDPTENTQDLKYRPFSLTGDIGPVVKYELTPRILIGVESYYRPTDFYLDPATGDDRRSGGGVFSKVSAEYVSGYTWWNPTAYVSFEWVHSSGLNYRSYNYGGGFSDTIPVTEKFALTGSLDMLSSDYFYTVPDRQDFNMGFRVAGTYPIADHWTGTADLGYTDNESSISTVYKYNRWVADIGATYAF